MVLVIGGGAEEVLALRLRITGLPGGGALDWERRIVDVVVVACFLEEEEGVSSSSSRERFLERESLGLVVLVVGAGDGAGGEAAAPTLLLNLSLRPPPVLGVGVAAGVEAEGFWEAVLSFSFMLAVCPQQCKLELLLSRSVRFQIFVSHLPRLGNLSH